MVMIMVVMAVVMVVSAAAFAVMMMIMVVMIVVMVVSTTAIVIMMMVMGCDSALQYHVDAGILQRMDHGVSQTVLLHIEDGRHEREVRTSARSHLAAEHDALPEIGEIHGHRGIIGGDGHLYVTHECTGLPLDPSSDIRECIGQPRFDIRVETVDLSVDTDRDSSGLLC